MAREGLAPFPMVLLRCSKCGSDTGFLIETHDKDVLEIEGRLQTDRIKATVLVTCTYCNARWDQVPARLEDASRETAPHEMGRLSH